jgi:formylglycine-generating enzyme required for sulfatase activity/serine/threonine protein kinase
MNAQTGESTQTKPDPLKIVGTIIGEKYRIDKLVGEGGFALVYRAEHLVWKKPVAIKVFFSLKEAPADQRDSLLADFLREGSLLAELSAKSASIVQARDVATLTAPSGEWMPYLVLEWLDGIPLDGYLGELASAQLRQEPVRWSVEAMLAVVGPIGDALGLVHRSGVVHRDVKPSNIFLVGKLPAPDEIPEDDSLQVKLLDFGIAKAVASAADLAKTSTEGFVTAFTPPYGAPEQFSRQWGATGPATDVFALALVAVELLAGRPALDGDDFVQLGMCACDPHRRPTPRTLGVSLADPLEAVFAKALSLKPEDRYASGSAFVRALRAIVYPEVTGALLDVQDIVGGPSSAGASSRIPFDVPASGLEATYVSATAATMLPEARPPQSIPIVAPPSQPLPSTSTPSAVSFPAEAKPARPPFLAIGAVAAVALGVAGWFGLHARETPKTVGSASAAVVAPMPSMPGCPEGMLMIPGGEFYQGSNKPPDSYADDEKPAHHVTLNPFCIDKTEVTVAAYKACSDRGACLPAADTVEFTQATANDRKLYSQFCTIRDPGTFANHPINCVDWSMADTYCKRAKKRLPTESEWEFAARGPDGRTYSWGNDPPDETRMNACGKECSDWGKKNGVAMPGMYPGDDKWPSTAPVGSFPAGASRFGLLDVEGNVWEWTADFYGPYTAADVEEPKGPPTGTERVIRGGGWNGAQISWGRPTKRYSFEPTAHTHVIGFRCAADPGK